MIVFSTFSCGKCHIDYRTGHDPRFPFTCPQCGTVLYEGQPTRPIKAEPVRRGRLFFKKIP